MGRGNKNTAVAALIKEHILSAASRLFTEKGFSASRIDDISAMSGYSRRTIYAYFESKEDILDHITVKGLSALLGDIRSAAASNRDITGRWLDICGAMLRYKAKYPTSDRAVEASSPDKLTKKELSPARKEILRLGSEINDLLAGFIRDGISSGEVRPGILPRRHGPDKGRLYRAAVRDIAGRFSRIRLPPAFKLGSRKGGVIWMALI